MSNGSKFKKAERTKEKLKLAVVGPSGGGKTMSSLRLAKGIDGRIAVIDTENGSASLYSDRFDFETLKIYPPYTTAKYLEAMDDAVKEGFDIVVIDSISHQWAGEGGILSRKEQMDSRGGNSFANWGKMTPEQEKFKSAILHYPKHLIVTIRSKQEYVLSENDKGKQSPKKVGMAPVQRDGMEYEFTTVFDVAMNHEAAVSKDRTGLFDDSYFKITEETGKILKQWLDTGKEREVPHAPTANTGGGFPNPQAGVPPQNQASVPSYRPPPQAQGTVQPKPENLLADERRKKLVSLVGYNGWSLATIGDCMFQKFGGKRKVEEFSTQEFTSLTSMLIAFTPAELLVAPAIAPAEPYTIPEENLDSEPPPPLDYIPVEDQPQWTGDPRAHS